MSNPRRQRSAEQATGLQRTRRVRASGIGGTVTPAIYLPVGRFRPPHCPNRRCRYYRVDSGWRYRLFGFYGPRFLSKPLQRYQCLHCGRTFTARTFSPTYWLHRWDLFVSIAALSVAGCGLRQIARTVGISHATVQRHVSRAGRHCLVFHGQMVKDRPIDEAIAFDGFETFEFSQYFPFHVNLAVGHRSWFIHHFTESPLRRKGMMTLEQKVRRAELELALGRPDPKAVESGILELLRVVCRQSRKELRAEVAPVAELEITLNSDDHPAYKRALHRLRRESWVPPIRHHITPSTDPRTRANPLFPCNLADQLLRHSGANHRRETIAFSKRRQGTMERAAIFTVWRNTVKHRRENKPGDTAAMEAGLLDRVLTWRCVFSRRRFPRRAELPGSWWSYYWRRIRTAALPSNTEHKLRFAF